MRTSTITVTPWSPAEVISSVLVPMVSLRFFAMSLICDSVTWNGLSRSQRFSSSMPSRTWSESVSRLSITCQTTNQPTRPMTTKPSTAVTAVARPRGSPSRLSRTTVGWSSAVTSRAATKARTTSWTALMTRISTQRVPARTSSRQPASAATRIPQGIAATGSGFAAHGGGVGGRGGHLFGDDRGERRRRAAHGIRVGTAFVLGAAFFQARPDLGEFGAQPAEPPRKFRHGSSLPPSRPAHAPRSCPDRPYTREAPHRRTVRGFPEVERTSRGL